jgi:hypothetical protein
MIKDIFLKTRTTRHMYLETKREISDQPGQRGLQECWRSAQRSLTSISAAIRSDQPGQRALQECWRSAQRWSPRSPLESDRTSRGREPCGSAGAVSSPGSPQSPRQWHRHCRGRVASIFVAWSSLWPCFVGTLHCLLFAICLADRHQQRATYCTHTAW